MMDLFQDSPCKNSPKPSIGLGLSNNIHKRRSTTWENDDSQEKETKRVKLQFSKSLQDQKTPRRVGLPTRASKVIAPTTSKAPTPATTGGKGKIGSQNLVPPQNTKSSTATQTEPQKMGSEICDTTEYGNLKCDIQKALEEHHQCTKLYKKSERTYSESLLKLGILMEKIKRHLPSMLDSLPADVSQSLEDLKDRKTTESVSVFKQDADLAQTLTQLSKEFSSCVLVLEKIPESRQIKERLLTELQNKEELFEENYAKFKQNKPWLLNKGIQVFEFPDQNFLRKKYKNYFQLLEMKLLEMKLKRKELVSAMTDTHDEIQLDKTICETEDSVKVHTDPGSRMLDVRKPAKDKAKSPAGEVAEENCFTRHPPSLRSVNDSFHSGFQIITSPLSNLDSSCSLASPTTNSVENDMAEGDESDCEENNKKEVKEDTKNGQYESANQKGWPGKSLPDLNDLVSDESIEETFCGAPTSNDSNEKQTCQNTQPMSDIHQEGLNNDQSIVEALITEVGPELALGENGDESQNIGSHFLAPELTASVFSPTSKGFLYNVALQPVQPTQEPRKKLFHPAPSLENTCSECQQNFSSKEKLYAHKLYQHASRICNFCVSKFDNVNALKEHVAHDHALYTVCSECFDVVETSSLKAHATKHPKTNVEVDEEFKCRACIQTFSTQEEVKTHEKTHKNAFHFCKHCGDLFLTRFEIQKHSSQEHLAVMTNICKVCYLDFYDRPSLLKHLKIVHNMISNKSPRNYLCICCHHQSGTKMELIQHMRCNHQNDDLVVRASQGEDNGLTKNKCPHCNLYFKNMKVRAVHEIFFHETPPFRCVCNVAFYTKAMLDEHTLKHNRTDEEKLKPRNKRNSRKVWDLK